MNKFQNSSNAFMWGVGFLMAVFVAGCGSDGGGSSAPGTLSVSLTDAPACGYDQVNVTVSKVRIHQSDSADDKAAGWTDITLNPPKKINLLDLNDPTKPNFALLTLGETPLAAGHYTQLRLVLDRNTGQPWANSVVLTSDPNTEIALDTPSGIQSGIKLIHQFDVGSGQRVDLLLDFDACKSIVQTGNNTYKLKPVIKVIPTELNGINGFVDNTLTNVRVSAQQNGEIIRETVMNAQTGEFFLAHLDPGNYDVVITADGHAAKVISGVPIPTSTSITAVSTKTMPAPPITLDVSTIGNIGGTVTLQSGTDEETVFMAAKQTFGSGLTVTAKSQVASLITGGSPGDYQYSLALPTGAPSLGPYATPLPIHFTSQAPVANKYTVEASSTGYVTGSAPNVSTGTTQNFNLNLAP